ncbi:MAG: C40 family peptidase [bacterium]|nr:C40 family peptidase [bacterium]
MKLFFGIAMAFWSLTVVAGAETLYNFHEVGAGETVESIASFYKTSASEIVRSNAQVIKDNNGLQPGMILVVPKVQSGTGSASGMKASGTPAKSAAASAPGTSGKEASGKKSAKKAPPKPPSAVSHASAPTAARKAQKSRGDHYRSKPSRPAPSSKPSYRDKQYNAVSYSNGALRSEEKKRPSYSRRNTFTQESKAVSSDGFVAVIPAYVPPAVVLPGAGSGIVDIAYKYMGVPYVWGGSTPDGFDCSGFVQFVYREAGFDIPRTADVQFEVGDEIDCGNEAPGDMVFFETYTQGASHVGIYIGDGEFIHASSRGDVRISSLDEDYFKARYLGARRIY